MGIMSSGNCFMIADDRGRAGGGGLCVLSAAGGGESGVKSCIVNYGHFQAEPHRRLQLLYQKDERSITMTKGERGALRILSFVNVDVVLRWRNAGMPRWRNVEI